MIGVFGCCMASGVWTPHTDTGMVRCRTTALRAAHREASNPQRWMIDRMIPCRIVGSVGPLHGPGRQRSHASAGQPDRPEGEDQLGPTTSHLGPCRRRTFLRTNQMCSTYSLRLRRRHHRLPGIHRRRHLDRRAATLRGSGPVSGPVAGRASLGANLCVQSDRREQRAGRFLSCSGETCERTVRS